MHYVSMMKRTSTYPPVRRRGWSWETRTFIQATSGRVQEEYITDLEHLNDGRDADGKLATEGSFLEINAVDGTVYNAEVGY